MTFLARRTYVEVQPALTQDAAGWFYSRVWRPILVIQLVLYTIMAGKAIVQPEYAIAPRLDFPLLKQNHLDNFVSLHAQPDLILLGIHVAMAWVWIAATLLQKELVRRMAGGLDSFLRVRTFHVVTGWILCALAFAGVFIGAWIAWRWHANEPMRDFLVAQPVFFLPCFAMVVLTALRRRWSIRYHRFWAETAFLGPAVASLWTEIGIFVTQRFTSLGPNGGEYWSSVAGGALGFLVVVLPAFVELRRGLAADAATRLEPVHA